EAERQRVAFGLSFVVFDLDDTDAWIGVVFEREGFDDSRRLRLLLLAAEPPRIKQIRGKDLLELVLFGALHERVPVAEGGELRDVVDRDTENAPARRRLEHEPVE